MKKLSNIFLPIIILVVLIIPVMLPAQDFGGPDPEIEIEGPNSPSGGGIIKIINPFKSGSIPDLIETIVENILMPIGGVVAVLMIMYAGFLYVTAAGDPGQIEKAHDALLWAVIGAAILLGAWVISKAIKETIDQLRT